MMALMFLTEKRDSTIKGRMVYNGKPTREWLSREDSASPTAALESKMLTAVIEAHEGRDVMTVDIPNTFIQTEMPEREEGEEWVIMKITGVLVEMMVQLNPDKYGPCVVFEKGKKVVYVQVLRNGTRLQREKKNCCGHDWIHQGHVSRVPREVQGQGKGGYASSQPPIRGRKRRRLDCNQAEMFHTVVAKGLFISK